MLIIKIFLFCSLYLFCSLENVKGVTSPSLKYKESKKELKSQKNKVKIQEKNNKEVVNSDDDEPDPLEKINRVIFQINRFVDKIFIKPASLVYKTVVPSPIRKGIYNFQENLFSPVLLLNCALQGRAHDSAKTVARTFINSIFGFLGTVDVAEKMKLSAADTNFNETLIQWNVQTGPYLMLPLFGPSSFRGTIGRIADLYSNPAYYISQNKKINHNKKKQLWKSLEAIYGLNILQTRIKYMSLIDDIEKTSIDHYLTIRNLYFQRQAELKRRLKKESTLT
jgi:phospholipid-binding lipoprotein MlaA